MSWNGTHVTETDFTDAPGDRYGGPMNGHAAEDHSLPAALTVREMVDAFPALRPPVIHGLCREGETMNVISSPKVGKSWIVLQLAISVATGRMFLDRFSTTRGEVLILDNELHPETSASRVPTVGQAMGVMYDEYADRIQIQSLRGKLKDVYSLDAYFRTLEPGRFKLVIVDAFYRALPKECDENDNGSIAQLYNEFDRYAAMLGCSFVLIHHTSKGGQGHKSVTDTGSGAGSQSRAADCHLVLRQHREDRVIVLDAAVRSWKPVEPFCLRWDFPTFIPDDTLDPTDLRTESRRGPRREASEGETIAPPAWTPETFAERFIDGSQKTADEILINAKGAGMSMKMAEMYLGAVVGKKLAFKWEMGSKKKALYSTESQPTILSTIENAPKSKPRKGQ